MQIIASSQHVAVGQRPEIGGSLSHSLGLQGWATPSLAEFLKRASAMPSNDFMSLGNYTQQLEVKSFKSIGFKK